MGRRIAAIAIVAVVAVAAIAGVAVYYAQGPYSTSFIVEERLDAKYPNLNYALVSLSFNNCTLNVSFVNDTSLLYRMDITLHSAASRSSAIKISALPPPSDQQTMVEVDLGAYVPVKNASLFLGNGIPYDIAISGTNLTSTIIYGNSCLVGKKDIFGTPKTTTFGYTATGRLHFEFHSDVKHNQFGLDVTVGYPPTGNMTLLIDLPQTLNGLIDFISYDPISVTTTGRWFMVSTDGVFTRYATVQPATDPRLYIHTERWRISGSIGG